MQLTRLLVLFIAGLFIKKTIEEKQMEKLFSNIAKYKFDTIRKGK